MKIRDRSGRGFDIIKGILLTILSLLCVLPFIVIVSGSFTSNQEIIRNGFSLLPRGFTAEAYGTIFKTPEDILQAYKMNFYYTFIGTALGLIIITLTAYVISRKEFKYRNKVSFLIYFTTIFGGGMIPWYLMYANVLNLRGTTLAIWFPALITPFLVILMRTFIVGAVPDAVVESAKIDGAGHWRIFWRIVRSACSRRWATGTTGTAPRCSRPARKPGPCSSTCTTWSTRPRRCARWPSTRTSTRPTCRPSR